MSDVCAEDSGSVIWLFGDFMTRRGVAGWGWRYNALNKGKEDGVF